MNMIQNDIAVALYDNHPQAEEAVKMLQRAGFNMETISIIGKDYHTEEHVIGYLNAGDRAKIFGKFGALWGGMLGLLFGSAMLFIPVLGHIIIIGPLAASIFGALEGAALVGGASALVGALTALGIPKNSVLNYETALKADKFMLVVNSNTQEIEKARDLLKGSSITSFEHHESHEQFAKTLA